MYRILRPKPYCTIRITKRNEPRRAVSFNIAFITNTTLRHELNLEPAKHHCHATPRAPSCDETLSAGAPKTYSAQSGYDLKRPPRAGGQNLIPRAVDRWLIDSMVSRPLAFAWALALGDGPAALTPEHPQRSCAASSD